MSFAKPSENKSDSEFYGCTEGDLRYEVTARGAFFKANSRMALVIRVKGRQAIHVNHDRVISRKRKESEATARGLSCRK